MTKDAAPALVQLTQAGTRWRLDALRSHPSARLIIITKGQGRITIAGLTNGYGPQTLIYVPAQTIYAIEIGQGVFGQILTIPDDAGWPRHALSLRLPDPRAQKDASQYLDHIDKELQQGGDRQAADLWLNLLAIFVRRQAATQPATVNDSRRANPAAKLVARYTQLIARDFRSDRNVAGYAAELGVTPTHLARCCSLVAGQSALGMLHARIHTEACHLLRDTATPIHQIADQLGFQSAAYFTRSFQGRSGQTPSGFRRANPR